MAWCGNGGFQIDSAIITEKWGGEVQIEKVACVLLVR